MRTSFLLIPAREPLRRIRPTVLPDAGVSIPVAAGMQPAAPQTEAPQVALLKGGGRRASESLGGIECR